MNDSAEGENREDAQIDLHKLANGLVAFRDAFLEQHGPAINSLNQFMKDVDTRLSNWLEANRPALEQITEGLATFLENVPEWQENLHANMILLERGLEVLRAEGFSSTGFVFSAHDGLNFGASPPAEVTAKLYEVTASEAFRQELLALYKSSQLRPERTPLIDEALILHGKQSFGGSTALLYSQLEGLVSDAMVAIGAATPAGAFNVASQGKTLRGMHDKFTKMDATLQHTEVFSELLQGVLSNADEKSTVSRTRNAVLHGGDVSFATFQRSTQLVLWTFAVLIELRAVLPHPALGTVPQSISAE